MAAQRSACVRSITLHLLLTARKAVCSYCMGLAKNGEPCLFYEKACCCCYKSCLLAEMLPSCEVAALDATAVRRREPGGGGLRRRGGGTPEQLLPSLKAANLANTIVLNTANLELTLRDQFFNMYTMYVVVPYFSRWMVVLLNLQL